VVAVAVGGGAGAVVPASAAAFARRLAAQSWDGWEVVEGLPEAIGRAQAGGHHLLVADAEAALAPTALEKMVWFLETHPEADFVTGRLDGAPAAAPFCEALAAATLVSAAAVRTLAAGRPPAAPPLPLSVAASVVQGTRRVAGFQLQEPLVSLADRAALAAAVAPWTAAGVTDRALGGTGRDPVVAPRPVQALDVRDTLRTRHVAPASGRRVLALLQGFVLGGYTSFNVDVIPRLVAAGHAVTVCTTEFWRTDFGLDRVLAATPDVHHLPGFLPPEQFLRYVAAVVASREVDTVLVSHSFFGYHALPWLRQAFPGVAFVDYVHTDWFEPDMYGSYAATSAAFAGELDAHMASSAALGAQLAALGADAGAVHVSHINIDADYWRRAPHHDAGNLAALRGGRAGPVILFAGRAAPEKRPLLAVELLAELAAREPFTLVVAGGGPLLDAMRRAAVAAGIGDRCVFLGDLAPEHMRAVYAVGDIHFAPSAIEGVARTLYESMAMGCVPVAADVGGQRELVAPECGFVVAPGAGERQGYLAALGALCADPALRARMAAAARERVEARFSAARCAESFGRAFDAAAARRAAGAPAAGGAAAALRTAALGVELSRRNYLRHVPTG
jgi:glycosyltransferase involved in cell wall biosynthesis